MALPWYIYSILSALCFAGMILATRYLGNKGFSAKQILLFLFFFAFFECLILNFSAVSNILKPENLWLFLGVMAIVGIFAVAGNIADFTAVIEAPNPGFATAIKTSNILIITFFSTLIFRSPLDSMKILGGIFILLGVLALVLEKDNIVREKKSSRWKLLALAAALSFSIAILLIKSVSPMGFSSVQINLFVFAFNLVGFAFFSRRELKSWLNDKAELKTFLPAVFLAGTLSFIANLLHVKGIMVSSNPGYHQAIVYSQMVFITLFSAFLFKANLNKQKILGVVLCFFGIILLVI